MKKIGSVRTLNGLTLVVSRNNINRTVHLKFGSYLFIVTSRDAEKLKNLLEEADSGV